MPRHNTQDHDHPLRHPNTTFVPEEDVQAMEQHVADCRASMTSRGSRRHPANVSNVSNEDHYKRGMNVPISVLDNCHDSFATADEKRKKASTTFFADTGLMALLCHHDCVLWLVNMISAGEQQHYALALLQRLFQNLPAPITVGVLYDNGC